MCAYLTFLFIMSIEKYPQDLHIMFDVTTIIFAVKGFVKKKGPDI